MNMRITHLAYRVSDMKKSLEFYVDKLGFDHAFSIPNDQEEPWIEYIKVSGGQFIELFYPEGDYSAKEGSYLHLCLQVEDLHEVVRKVEAAGVEVWSGPAQGKDSNWQAWISDPDGNKIELMQISPQSPQYKAGMAD